MIKPFETLYKRGRNTILEWVIKIEERNHQVNIIKTYGTFEGEHVIRYQNNIKGKNIGKSNETSPLEQADLECESAIALKEKEGYVRLSKLIFDNQMFYQSSLNLIDFIKGALPEYNTDDNGNEIPMKCQQYYRSRKDWTDPNGVVWDDRKYYYIINPYAVKPNDAIIANFPCFIQPKVNGVRAFCKLVDDRAVLYSKKGLVYNLPHITDWFNENKQSFNTFDDNVIFDGELYIPGESLQNIGSAVKTHQFSSLTVEYHVFDLAITELDQTERIKLLYNDKTKFIFQNSPIKLVPTKRVMDDNRVQQLTDEYISYGYEGSILRDYKGMYEFGKRPKTITKLKRIMDEEFEIVDVIPTDKDPEIGLFVCITPAGHEVKVNPKGNTDFKKWVLVNKDVLIGKQLTCYFYEYTDKGLPFHIIDNIVRDYE